MNDVRRAAIAQTLLEGAALPAGKRQLLAYAREQDAPADVVAALESIPDREYGSLDAVGEAIAPTQPAFAPPAVHRPQVESDEVPGGGAYLDTASKPGAIREDPEVLPYVREPAPVGEGVPKAGSRDRRPKQATPAS
ncbi:MAG TPA: DUF2795 domain-containing protein [Gaiellaceae bacterium]|nr:DUF2795 domain-containing protein [Gaiellaceae bacterium]